MKLPPADVSRLALIALVAPSCPDLAGEDLVEAARAHVRDRPGQEPEPRPRREGDAELLFSCLRELARSKAAIEAFRAGEAAGDESPLHRLLTESLYQHQVLATVGWLLGVSVERLL